MQGDAGGRSPAPVRSRSMDCERKTFISPRFAFGAMVPQGRQSGTETMRCGVDRVPLARSLQVTLLAR